MLLLRLARERESVSVWLLGLMSVMVLIDCIFERKVEERRWERPRWFWIPWVVSVDGAAWLGLKISVLGAVGRAVVFNFKF